MKRIIKVLSLVLLILFTKDVYAASASISANKTTATKGENVTINVNCNGAAWNLHLNGSINDSIVGYNNNGKNENCSKSFSLNTQSTGTYTINLTGDITDQDETEIEINNSVTITVVEPQPVNNQTNNTKETKNEKKSEEKKVEEKPTKNVEKDEKNQIKSKENLKITKFEIVGYNVKFDVNKKEYLIDILENTTDLYVIIEGDNIEVSQQGKINIKNKDLIEISISNQDVKNTYKIKLNRISKEKIPKVEAKDKSILFILILVFIIVMTSIIIIVNKIKKRRREI